MNLPTFSWDSSVGRLAAAEEHQGPLAVAGSVGGDGAEDEIPDHALAMVQEQHALGLNILCLFADVGAHIHCHVHRVCTATASC